jgi:transposase
MKQTKKRAIQAADLEQLSEINLDAAGIDIGDSEIYVAVPSGRSAESVRCFGTFTADLHQLVAWLTQCGIKSVAMESTGIYWMPLYELLEAAGFEVCLVNARHFKNVSGRKSDVLDCQWLQQLHTYGLLKGSFRPSEAICALRALSRQRQTLVQYRAAHIQHMQKALQQMNLKLTNVLSDITGVTGLQIIRAILAGERSPLILAQYRDPRCQKSEHEIAKSLEGNYRTEHLFALAQAFDLYTIYTTKISECDAEIETHYSTFTPAIDLDQHPLPPPRRPARQPLAFDLRTQLYRLTGVDLTQIDGIDSLTAQTIIAEIGTDMSPWPTARHFASWLGLCPNNLVSGGKVLKRTSRKVVNPAATALRQAAQSLSRSQSALGAFYRRMRTHHGPQVANKATAHKLARIIYHLLKNSQPYLAPSADTYEQHYRQRLVRNLQRQAQKLGFALHPAPDQAASVS